MQIFFAILLGFLLVCAISVSLSKNLLNSILIYMSYSLVASVIWILLESPDLAITEAAVGAGVTTVLFFCHAEEDTCGGDTDEEQEEEPEQNRRREKRRRKRMSKRVPKRNIEKTFSFRLKQWLDGTKDPFLDTVEMKPQKEFREDGPRREKTPPSGEEKKFVDHVIFDVQKNARNEIFSAGCTGLVCVAFLRQPGAGAADRSLLPAAVRRTRTTR